jgi:hypothetical protein
MAGPVVIQSRYNTATPVIIQGANPAASDGVGGSVYINSGWNGPDSTSGEIVLQTANSQVNLGSYGDWTMGGKNGTASSIFSYNDKTSTDYSSLALHANSYYWGYTNYGNIVFPDDTEQATAWTGAGAVVSDTAPNLPQGGIWFNDTDARGYVYYNGQWVDMNPTMVPDASYYTGNLRIIDNLISSDINRDANLYVQADTKTWNFSSDGRLIFPDGTIQLTAFAGLDTLTIDGGGPTVVLEGGRANTWLRP